MLLGDPSQNPSSTVSTHCGHKSGRSLRRSSPLRRRDVLSLFGRLPEGKYSEEHDASSDCDVRDTGWGAMVFTPAGAAVPFQGGIRVAASALSDTIVVKKASLDGGADGIVRRDTGRRAGAKIRFSASACCALYRQWASRRSRPAKCRSRARAPAARRRPPHWRRRRGRRAVVDDVLAGARAVRRSSATSCASRRSCRGNTTLPEFSSGSRST